MIVPWGGPRMLIKYRWVRSYYLLRGALGRYHQFDCCKRHHEVAGVLWGSGLLCCASSCSGVRFATDIPRARLIKSITCERKKITFFVRSSYEPGGREFESLRAHHKFRA